MVITFPANRVPKGLQEGMQIMLGGGGQKIPARVTAIKADGSAVLDANPKLAGKVLTFKIKVTGFKEPSQRGVKMVGWQGKDVQVPGGISNSRVSKVFQNPQWPAAWPYKDSDFRRQDESDDSRFYDQPRFVTHIDDGAIGAIRDCYACHFAAAPQGEYSVLDICSSWISHYPQDLRAKRVAITGMVEKELAANKQATEYKTKNLNVDPTIPFGDNEFDFVTNVVSVDYLNTPRAIFNEMHRVLKPGGVAIMSFSNRCFGSKAIAMWVANMNDGPGHCQIVGNYFHFNPDRGWRDISSADISPNPGRGDPMWVVTAVKA
jgi:SAM-dependent methyltransferase